MKYIFTTVAIFLSVTMSNGQFDPAFEEYLEETMIFIDEEVNPVGLSISVRSGDNVWNNAIGISSIEDSLSIASIFAMGSITKTFISAGILKLMEENRLSLSDPIHMYLPSFENIDSNVTIKELLYHTSGIHDYSFHPDYYSILGLEQNQFYQYSPEETLEQFLLEEEFERGTQQEYSNTNYVLLGMIITEISGRAFYEEIFDAFNIAEEYPSISYPPFNSDVSDLANLWSDFGNGFENIQESGIGLDGLFSTAGASGAFAATAADLAKWGYDLYSGKLLKESTMDSLYDYHPLLLWGALEYGLGVFNIETSCEINAVGHDGAIFYGSDLAYSEELDLSVAVMTNDSDGLPEIGGFLTIKEEIFCAYKEFLITNSEEIIEEDEVEIYPNPVNDILNINLPQSFDQSTQIEIYNEIGSLVHFQKMRNEDRFNMQIDCFDEMARGFYFIKVFDNDNSYTERLIKTN